MDLVLAKELRLWSMCISGVSIRSSECRLAFVLPWIWKVLAVLVIWFILILIFLISFPDLLFLFPPRSLPLTHLLQNRVMSLFVIQDWKESRCVGGNFAVALLTKAATPALPGMEPSLIILNGK